MLMMVLVCVFVDDVCSVGSVCLLYRNVLCRLDSWCCYLVSVIVFNGVLCVLVMLVLLISLLRWLKCLSVVLISVCMLCLWVMLVCWNVVCLGSVYFFR